MNQEATSSSRERFEPFESATEKLARGVLLSAMGRTDGLAVKLLETVQQHRPILLVEHVGSHHDPIVRMDGQQVAVEGCVVELAECEAVGDDRLPLGVSIANDVRGVEQLAAT